MREFGGRSENQHSSGRVDGFEKRTAIIYLRMILQLELEICNNSRRASAGTGERVSVIDVARIPIENKQDSQTSEIPPSRTTSTLARM